MIYYIEPDRRTLHGHFSRDLPAVLTIDSGDTVVFRTLDARWSIAPRTSPVLSDTPPEFSPRDPLMDGGHALCGPVHIHGAAPGMTLEVQIVDILPAAWGWTTAGGRLHPVNERFSLVDTEVMHLWTLDNRSQTAVNQHGHKVRLRPFMGVMGMPADAPGILSTAPPRATGGNLDCKELISGSRLFLPIAVPGGLFSTGAGHAAQGDGEVSITAIECPMERAELKFILHDDMHLTGPRAETDSSWITFGIHEDIQEAMYMALNDMIKLIQDKYEIGLADAMALASVTVDLRITQIVNGVRGVHAVLAKEAILQQ